MPSNGHVNGFSVFFLGIKCFYMSRTMSYVFFLQCFFMYSLYCFRYVDNSL